MLSLRYAMSSLTPKISDPSDLCHECFKNFTEIGVIGIRNGEVYQMFYCSDCWHKIKRRPFKKEVSVDDQKGRDDTDK